MYEEPYLLIVLITYNKVQLCVCAHFPHMLKTIKLIKNY